MDIKAELNYYKKHRDDAEKSNDHRRVGYCDGMINLLQELQIEDCSKRAELECGLRPATKFLKCKNSEHKNKIFEEYIEVQQAYLCDNIQRTQESRDHLIEEIIDVQMVCETWLAALGLDGVQRAEARQSVIGKNAKRGIMMNNDMEEIKAAAMPLVELMRRKYNPHNKIIVTLDRIEVLSGETGIQVEVED